MRILTRSDVALLLLCPVAAAQGPQPFCTAGSSTNGCTPSLSANVQPDSANSAGCVITTSGVEGQRQGVVFYGVDNSAFSPVPWSTLSTSLLCVKSPVARLGSLVDSGGVAGQCDGTFVLDWDGFHTSHPLALGQPWSVGQRVFVQSWYRDPPAPRGSNLSNALELTLRAPAPTPCVTPIAGMVAIAPGTFMMGSAAASGWPYFNTAAEQPVHQVTLSYCFWMGATEVTQAEYSALMGFSASVHSGPNRPVDSVIWTFADDYCEALNASQVALGAVPPGYEYRLPTEAEWEYACRAGTTTEFNTGAELLCGQASFGFSQHTGSPCLSNATTPVGSFAPNPWGLYDMHGNVWEWCLDSFDSYSAVPVTDPFVTGGPLRVLRGGSWNYSSQFCRSAIRGADIPGGPPFVGGITGFRVVLAPILVP